MILELVLLVVLLVGLLYRWITKSFDKWEKEGLPHDKPSFPSGTHSFLSGKKHLNDFVLEDYKKFKMEQGHRVHGWFLLGKPALSINDPDLLKQIQVKDFNHFVDRNEVNMGNSFQKGGELDRLWGKSLDNAMGDTWKNIRSTFTPIFTSGKMKTMLPLIREVSGQLTDELARKAEAGQEFNLKEVFGKYSLDGLASCAFGVDAQSFTNDKSVFVKYAADIFTEGAMDNLAFLLKLVPGMPSFLQLFNINLFKKTPTKYFRDMVKKTLEARRKSKDRRNDLVDLMLDCLDKAEEQSEDEGFAESKEQFDKDQKFSHNKDRARISEDDVVATAMVLLVAGYDTTGITLSYLSYAMSKNPDVQEKLQEEVDAAFEDNNGEMPDYSTIQSLPYLDMVIHETLRKFNPVSLNTRSCTQEFRIPGTDITVKAGDLLTIPISGFHQDPEHFSHPEEFYPEHFSKEEKATRNPYAFQAFGAGPRSCIGMRFALLEAKVAILNTWRRFTFLPGTKTKEPLVADPEHSLGFCNGGVWANIVERKELQLEE